MQDFQAIPVFAAVPLPNSDSSVLRIQGSNTIGARLGPALVKGLLEEQGLSAIRIEAGNASAVVESVKAAADIYMPVTGEVVEVNDALRDNPALANSDPMGEGWFFKVKVTDMGQFDALMDPPGYDALLKTL